MLNKTKKEVDDFTLNIKTTKNADELLNYINVNFYSSIKLLISISKTFSIYWKVVLPIIVSVLTLLLLSFVEDFRAILNINYLALTSFILLSFTIYYVLNSKKHLIFSIKKAKEKLIN